MCTERPIDLWEVIHGYIIAVPAGCVVWTVTRLLAEGHFPLPVPAGVGVMFVLLLPFAFAAVMILGLPFTLAFLWMMRHFRIRSLPVLLLGGAIAPSAAIFLGQSLMVIFSSLTTERGNTNASLGLSLDTIPAGMLTFYILYRLRLKPCFEKGMDN